jgi:hypothetical protein
LTGRAILFSIAALAGLQVAPALSMDAQSSVNAAVRLVMPFSCSLERGTLITRPGPERAYNIVGTRDQRVFTTCDPPFSNNCRSLTVHKFEVECGLDRVPWYRIVASVGRTTAGEATLSKGLLVLTREADGAAGHAPSCADRKTPAAGGGECLPWRVRKPMERMVLPQGFAPLGETGARIIDATTPSDYASADMMTLGAGELPGGGLYRGAPEQPSANEYDGLRPVAASGSEAQVEQERAGGWTTSLSFSTAEPSVPELVVATSSVSQPSAVNAAAAAPAFSLFPWIVALIASIGLAAAAYLHRTRQFRLAAPDFSGAADAALRNLRKAQDLTSGLIGAVSAGLKPSGPDEIAQDTDRLEDPTLASALLQLKAMFARTEAAVATLSATAVVREVMQTELAGIRSRLEEAERAARRGSTPMMKLAAQFRQIARDIDRVQNVTQSASRSLGTQA